MIEKFMRIALEEAKKAILIDEVPIGAVIVKGDEIISVAHNTKETETDATAHAELRAIQMACKRLGSWRLIDCDIYTTLEPCPMCAGAMIQARLANVYIGAKDQKTGAAGSKLNLFEDYTFNHKCIIHQGVLAEECSQILSDYFKQKRRQKQG